ncbi:hypothetical protein J1614_012176 [Plenodomus biglobosus]|nr:hypothetical protein J1614_012176 [Plenodomus biglobosus]
MHRRLYNYVTRSIYFEARLVESPCVCRLCRAVDEAHNVGGATSDGWTSIRWLGADFFCLLTATPIVWAAEKLTSLLYVLQDPQLNAEASELALQEKLDNVYETASSKQTKYRPTCAAFEKFFNRHADSIEQGRILNMAFQSVMMRRTYQSACETHSNGDTHSMQELMPPSIPVRIHVDNDQATRDMWANESSVPLSKLYHRDRSEGNVSDKLLVNGKYAHLLQLASFCILMFFASSIHDVGHNDTITEYQRLHDEGLYADYLYKLLVDIYAKGVIRKGYRELFPFPGASSKAACQMPSRSKCGKVVYAFSARSERIKLILALIADWVGRQGEKVLICCANPTEQEILNAILNLCGVRLGWMSSVKARCDHSVNRNVWYSIG